MKPAIICVDDEDIILRALKEQVRRAVGDKCTIEAITDPREALALIGELIAEQTDVPVIISDHIMPGMYGDEFLIASHLIEPRTAKILLTGLASAQAVGNVVNHASLYRYIAKPWEETDLHLTVAEAVRSFYQDKLLAEQNAMLRTLNEGLEELVEERTEQLSRRNRELAELLEEVRRLNTVLDRNNGQLRRLNEEKTEFLGIAAHDLKNPLTAISLNIRLVLRSHSDQIPDRVRSTLLTIGERTQQMLDLVTHFLDINAIEVGQVIQNAHQFDVAQALSMAAEQMADAAHHKEIDLLVEAGPKCMVYADRSAFFQIIGNLLSNALKFSPRGGEVHLMALHGKGELPAPDWVVLGVRDQGPGVSEADMARLFKRYTRLSARPTDGEPSSGFGLAIVKKLTEAMGGTVWCESEPGEGATFYVGLPSRERRGEATRAE
jgi:signal transduction histidine kinase